MAGEVQKTLESFGLKLPEVGKPLGSCVNTVRAGNLLLEQAQEAARLAALSGLAAAKSAMEDLDRIRRVVRVTGYVASAPGFYDFAKILDGASDILTRLFGEKGKHVRTAVGVSELPLNACVELELTLEVD
jgi:enamine deaminase RidA (YjgF/YER057c/UK114 family)